MVIERMGKLPPVNVNTSSAGRIIGVVGLFHFIALAFVCLRIYARTIILRVFKAEDVLISIAVVIALTAWICLVLQIPYGLGRHFQTIPTGERVEFERITFWKTVISDGVAMGLLRISMAISLLRLDKDLKYSIIMGILKAVYMYTTGGKPDDVFYYWVHVRQK
ncbi:uncharacterized protein LY79DRAFT_704627 [Colletotrichum navitas]|uniref:Rhodopsin domain-containing protein n=1 Tax=Colletotrichum navitas TaxID=681940 RepID=A0AAD8PWY1_9PEZI|nr:uncharacterized protein LY79DRAFT_704627 [Colletotrichum navitas]KAK1585690.1 hypothetical protein LY79DRAFT_704627 [Colletotrichum navitas]